MKDAPNSHHHKQYAGQFPRIAYKRIKSNGKMFVYDTKKLSLLPIAELREDKQRFHIIINNKSIASYRTIAECLKHITEKVL